MSPDHHHPPPGLSLNLELARWPDYWVPGILLPVSSPELGSQVWDTVFGTVGVRGDLLRSLFCETSILLTKPSQQSVFLCFGFLFSVLVFETGAPCVAQASLELRLFLAYPPEYWHPGT